MGSKANLHWVAVYSHFTSLDSCFFVNWHDISDYQTVLWRPRSFLETVFWSSVEVEKKPPHPHLTRRSAILPSCALGSRIQYLLPKVFWNHWSSKGLKKSAWHSISGLVKIHHRAMIKNREDPGSSVSGPSSPWGSRGAGGSRLAGLQRGLGLALVIGQHGRGSDLGCKTWRQLQRS